MAGEIKSFQENIRKTFIWYSLTPVIVIVITAFIIFIAAWGISLRESTRDDNEGITKRIENVMNDYYSMVDEVSKVMVDSDSNNKKLAFKENSPCLIWIVFRQLPNAPVCHASFCQKRIGAITAGENLIVSSV